MWRILPIVCLLTLAGCQDKIICAAFQSTYILDDSTRNAYYSYVWQLDEATRTSYLAGLQNNTTSDSLADPVQPVNQQKIDYYSYAGEKVVPWRVRSRTKYGIVKYEPYWLKNYRMRTAPMENIHPPVLPKPIETPYVAAELDSLGADSDSLDVGSLDSLNQTLVATEGTEKEEDVSYLYKYDPKDNFNVEQQYYNKYYGEKFIDNRPKPDLNAIAMADSLASIVPDSLQNERSRLKGLFKRNRNLSDSTAVETPEIEDTDGE
jgi:hypothetical protein